MTITFLRTADEPGAGAVRPLRRVPVSPERKAWSLLALAALLCLGSILFFWPGVATYDSVIQYRQVVSGRYDDWHPPAMARLWSLFHAAGWHGQAPLFLLQMLLYWTGLCLFGAALARRGAVLAGAAVVVLGLWPPFLGWQVPVLKDGQMIAALVAAAGIAGFWRLQARPLPWPAAALVLILLGYATLVRINAAFATVPLAFGLVGSGRWHRPLLQGAVMLAGIALCLALLPTINQRLLVASPSGVERALPLFDLGGIVHRDGPRAVPIVPAAEWRQAEADGCLNPILWDSLGDSDACGYIMDELHDRAPGSALMREWVGAIAHHPLAYAGHRLAHWNAEMRWWVPAGFPSAAPPAGSEPNTLGLRSPTTRVAGFLALCTTLAQSAVGAPMLWLALAFTALAWAWPASDSRTSLAVTLALSAILGEGAFLLIGIAPDYRYHGWAMLAAAMAMALVAGEPVPRLRRRLGIVLLLVVLGVALAARMTLAPVALRL